MEIMRTRLREKPKYNVVDLVGISRKCDWFICGNQLLKINNVEDPNFIFLSAFKGNDSIKNLVHYVLPKIKRKFILIIGSDDYTFPLGIGDKRHNLYIHCQEEIKTLFNNHFLIHIFVENMDTLHEKMSPIPLGILYDYDVKIQLNKESIITNVNFTSKSIFCFCMHRLRIGEQWQDRHNVTKYCTNEWKYFTHYFGESNKNIFISNLQKSIFCICVHGGGYDPCPRFFEAILYGAIPIIEHSPLDEVYSKFPVVFVDKWTPHCLSKSFLEKKLEELRPFYEDKNKRRGVLLLLSLDYWWNLIQDKYLKNI